jgi:hypothetical protein
MDIKSQLYSYYLDILNEITNYSSEKMYDFKNISFENLNISELLDKIKESTSELINLKVANSENSKGYSQLESYTKKLEYDIRIYHKKFFEYKIQNNALEDKIKIYRIIHEEFENLKEKVKYDGGKFLNNERKDNEIIILRQENNILKKEVAKLENLNRLNETLKNNYLAKIKNMQNEIDKLNKKLEIKYNSNNIRNFNTSNASNINININNNENILSKCIYKYDLNNANNNNETHKNSYNYLNNIKNLFKKTNKRPANYKLIKNIYMNSNNFRNNINSSTINTINNNIFTSNYNRIINNVSSKNKNKHTAKQNYSTIKNKIQNNSISMKIDKDEDKSVSLNKYIKSNDNKFSYKSDRKMKKSFSKIVGFKSTDNGPMSCQNKSSSKIRKYLNKKIGANNNEFRMKKNNSALNIKVNSK